MKTILITGAGSGIGRALAEQYASKEAQIVLAGRNILALEETSLLCKSRGAKTEIIQADLAVEKDIYLLAERALSAFGKIDILINNAGISQRGTAGDTIISVDRKVMEINYFAQIHLTKLLLPELRKQHGNIVVISSLSGLFGFPLRSAYAASKHALHGFFETLQLEEKYISTTIICPGRIQTDISINAVTADGSKHGKMDEGQLKGISVDSCARAIVKAVDRKLKLKVIAKEERILLWVYKYLRPLFYIIASKIKAT